MFSQKIILLFTKLFYTNCRVGKTPTLKKGKTMEKQKSSPLMFDNRILRGHITSTCGTIKEFAKKFGITEQAMQLKVANKSGWNRTDIIKAASILQIDNDVKEIWRTFFSLESWEIQK